MAILMLELNLLTQNSKHSSTTPHSLIGKEINNNNGNNHNNNNIAASTTPNSLSVAATTPNNNTNGLNLTQLGHFNQISEVFAQQRALANRAAVAAAAQWSR